MMLMTSNPDYIRQWATLRGGRPVKPLSQDWPCIDFNGQEADRETITWEEFFRLFDTFHLGMAYDPAPASQHYTLMPLEEESEEEPEQASPTHKLPSEPRPGEEDENFSRRSQDR